MATSDGSSRSKTQQSPLASQRDKEQSEKTTANSRPNRITQYFPMGYKEGFTQWWANISPAVAEHTVLSFVPYLQKPPTQMQTGFTAPTSNNGTISVSDDPTRKATPVTTEFNEDPYGPRKWYSNLVKLSGKDRALNEFSVERVGEEVNDHLVILHGYGAGLGFFYKNFEGLSRNTGWKLWALDMLGMGRSSRPPFQIKAKDPKEKITEAEDWFVDALEEWRRQRKVEKFTLLGHSLGGYLAVVYALKYPGRLNKLILASPVGIPEDPYAVNADMPDPKDSNVVEEFRQDQEELVNSADPTGKAGDNNNFLNARSKAEKAQAEGKSSGTTGSAPPRRPLPKWLVYLWESNISPFTLVRWAGPLGPRLVSGWTSRRFAHLPPEEAQALHNYAYSLFKLKGSGEYALAYILAPGAFARNPLIRRIQGVGRQMISPSPAEALPMSNQPVSQGRENGIPIVLMYGEHDWMDIAGGYAAEQKIKEEKEKVLRNASEEEKKADRGSAKVVIIRRAGHHVYLDGWEEFNEVMRREMDDVSRRRL